jgi:hypothetical protein
VDISIEIPDKNKVKPLGHRALNACQVAVEAVAGRTEVRQRKPVVR